MRRFCCPILGAVMAFWTIPREAFDYSSHIGIVEFQPGVSPCLTIQNASLKVGEPVTIIVMDKPQTLEIASIEKRLDKSCSRDPGVSVADFSYILRLPRTDSDSKPVSIAVARFAGEFRVKDGLANADLTSTGSTHSFRSCASAEGLHLTVWDDTPSRKWHRYFYLGYDVEPDCTEKEYRDAP